MAKSSPPSGIAHTSRSGASSPSVGSDVAFGVTPLPGKRQRSARCFYFLRETVHDAHGNKLGGLCGVCQHAVELTPRRVGAPVDEDRELRRGKACNQAKDDFGVHGYMSDERQTPVGSAWPGERHEKRIVPRAGLAKVTC